MNIFLDFILMSSDVACKSPRPISCHQANWIKILVKPCRYSKSCHVLWQFVRRGQKGQENVTFSRCRCHSYLVAHIYLWRHVCGP